MANFRNKSGFSLIEMVIAMGLATGLLVFYMKMQAEQAKKTLTAKVNSEIDTFAADFKGTMDRPGFCNKSFENSVISDNSSTAIQTIKNPRGDIRYEVGKKYGNNSLILKGITLKNFKPDDKEGFQGIANIQLDIDKVGNIYGSRSITKMMEVSVTRDEAKKILGCGSLSSGGINIQLAIPPSANPQNTNPASTPGTDSSSTNSTSPSDSNSNSGSNPQSPNTQNSPTSGGSFAPVGGGIDQKQLMQELEKNPELKKMHDQIKQMHDSQKEIDTGDFE